jgi:heme exporter protein A
MECGFDSRRPHHMNQAINRLTATDLHLWRGDLHVLRGVSLALQSGQCLQITGPNGAGKSTLLRALCGLLPIESGQVHWNGHDTHIDQLQFHGALAYLGHHTALKSELSARENLLYSVGMRRAITAAEADVALTTAGLSAAHAGRLVRQLSAGQQRRVALARVALMRSPLWILDEPTANLDTDGQVMFAQLLAAHLQDEGIAVVATHHPLQLAPGTLRNLELAA